MAHSFRKSSLLLLFSILATGVSASGHLPDIGGLIGILLFFVVVTWSAAMAALLFALKFVTNKNPNYRLAAFISAILCLAIESYPIYNLFTKNTDGFDFSFEMWFGFGLVAAPIGISLLSFLLMLTKKEPEPAIEEMTVTQPSSGWVNCFRVFIFVYYAYKFIQAINSCIYIIPSLLIHPSNSLINNIHLITSVYMNIFSMLLVILYAPAIIYLLLKRSKWCWVLLWLDVTITIPVLLIALHTLLSLPPRYAHSANHLVIQLLAETIVLAMVWHKQSAAYLNISKEERKQYGLVVAAVGIVLLVARFAGMNL